MKLLPIMPGPTSEPHQEREAVVGALAGLLLEATADPAEGENDDACI